MSALRRLLRLTFVPAALVSLGGCGISLFSHRAPPEHDGSRIAALERRMDAVEHELERR